MLMNRAHHEKAVSRQIKVKYSGVLGTNISVLVLSPSHCVGRIRNLSEISLGR